MSKPPRDMSHRSAGPAPHSWTARRLYPRTVTRCRTRDSRRDGRRLSETRPPVQRESASAGAEPCASREVTGTLGGSHMRTNPGEPRTAQSVEQCWDTISHQLGHSDVGSFVPRRGRHRRQLSTPRPHGFLAGGGKRLATPRRLVPSTPGAEATACPANHARTAGRIDKRTSMPAAQDRGGAV